MSTQPPPTVHAQDPDALLEKAFLDEYVRGRGYDPRRLQELPEDKVRALMTEASIYASDKLAEIEARAGFVEGMHGVIPSE